MLDTKRGFTVIQFIVGMTVVTLFVLAISVAVARQTWRNNQRKTDLAQVEAMISRYSETHNGLYPKTQDADDPGSQLQSDFAALRLVDPKADKYYTLGSKTDACDGGASMDNLGPGYISYKRPGQNDPYLLRICLEGGKEYYIAE